MTMADHVTAKAALDAEFENRLLKYINTEVSLIDDDLDSDTDLLLTGAVDSLGVIGITQWLEDEAGFSVEPTEVTLDNFQTVNRMLAYCRSKLG
jgi:acyl carrier protein